MFCEIGIRVICLTNRLLGHFQKRSLTFFFQQYFYFINLKITVCFNSFWNCCTLPKVNFLAQKFTPNGRRHFELGFVPVSVLEFHDVFLEEFQRVCQLFQGFLFTTVKKGRKEGSPWYLLESHTPQRTQKYIKIFCVFYYDCSFRTNF